VEGPAEDVPRRPHDAPKTLGAEAHPLDGQGEAAALQAESRQGQVVPRGGEKALADKSTRKAIASFQAALQQGDEEQQKAATEKLDEIDKAAEELWSQAEAEADKSKKKSLLTKLKTTSRGWRSPSGRRKS
jgi:hypothetical protein